MSGASLRRARRLWSQNQQVVQVILCDDPIFVDENIAQAPVPGRAELVEELQRRGHRHDHPATTAGGRQRALPSSNLFRLALTGPATRHYNIDVASELHSWAPWATLVNTGDTAQIRQPVGTNTNRLFFRAQLQ